MNAPPPRLPVGVLGWITASRARWVAIGALLCAVLPPFFSWPAMRPIPEPARVAWRQYWREIIQLKVEHPLYDYTRQFPEDTNQSKRNFRITVPLLAHASGFGMKAVPFVRFILQAVLVAALLVAAERACGDRSAALGVALAVAGTYVGTSVWMDEWGWFDNCAHAFMALGLAAASPALAAASVVAAGFTDERALLAVPLIMAFHAWTGARRRLVLSPAVGAAVYFAIRLALGAASGLRTPLAGVATSSIILPNLHVAPLGVWTALEGGWVLIAAACISSLRLERAGASLLLALLALVPIAASVTVIDFSRSASYAFPATLAAAALWTSAGPGFGPSRGTVRRVAAFAAAVSLLAPNAFIMGQTFIQPSVVIRALSSGTDGH